MTNKFAAMELATDEAGRMIILHPHTRQPLRIKNGEGGTEAYISLYSTDSAKAREHGRTVQRRRLAGGRRIKITPEEIEAENVELLAMLTTGWALCALDGSPVDIPFTTEAARELYANEKMLWLREQVSEFADDRANFSKASSNS